jgi:hypothetical protein
MAYYLARIFNDTPSVSFLNPSILKPVEVVCSPPREVLHEKEEPGR